MNQPFFVNRRAAWSGALVVSLFAAASSAIAVQNNEEWVAPSRAARKKNPVFSDEGSRSKGKALYARECLSCHGEKGLGDGSAVKDLEKKPASWADPKIWEQSDGALFWKISEGRKPMPSYETLLKEEERWHVMNYIRTLASQDAEIFPEFDVPESFRSALSEALNPYLQMQKGLNHDDLNAAKAGAALFADAVRKTGAVNEKNIDPKVAAAWVESRKRLEKSVGPLQEAKDLPALRTAFQIASDALAAAIVKFGHAQKSSPRRFHCPMAFEGKGAIWLQERSETENPYFGSTMSRCGKLEARLGGKKENKGGGK